MLPQNLELGVTERAFDRALQRALAQDEQVPVSGPKRRVIDLDAPSGSVVERDFRQRPSRVDHRFGQADLVEDPQRLRVNRERITVLRRPLVHVDDGHADAVSLQEQRGHETHRTGADDEDLWIRVTRHSRMLLGRRR